MAKREPTEQELWTSIMNDPAFKKAERTCCRVYHMLNTETCSVCGDQLTSWDDTKKNEFIEDTFIKSPVIERARKDKIRHEALNEYHKAHTAEGVFITLSIDQKQSVSEAIDSQKSIVDDLRKANYSWLVDARAVFEYWGKSDAHKNHDCSNLNWNPHVHIIVRKSGKLSVIRQHLARKFIEKKRHGVYIFDVKSLPYQDGAEYLEGDKIDVKMDGVSMDRTTRKENNVLDLIII